ncbi:hypothetical protein X945_5918 [Burkholderia pseudomallei ABCPW 107]|nr:hypothetical protein X989_5800 [Burkholderia pseudomallei MSHR4378]KGS35025.1 hypothetical protein X945_5918 [Burkholderia pseudomallei ABCPW 107]
MHEFLPLRALRRGRSFVRRFGLAPSLAYRLRVWGSAS